MKKDAYYFPHFSNARNDNKLVKLRRVMGIEGYGIYFLLLEVLREQSDFKMPIKNLEDLAYDWHTSKEKLLTVVTGFELFEVYDDSFFSPKQILYLQPYIDKTKRARDAANKRWNDVKALQKKCTSNANASDKEYKCNARKVKEKKESKVKEVKDFSIDFMFYRNDFKEIWENEFIEIKKKKKASTTERTLKSQLKKIEKLSGGNYAKALEILEKSVNSGWSDFYELKNDSVKKTVKPTTIDPSIAEDPDRMSWST